MTPLEKTLRAHREAGRKGLVVYLTGCFPDRARFIDTMRAVVDAGADVIEAGIPWSDPVIDGPLIQRASQAALQAGVTPGEVLDAAAEADVPVPVVAMTYFNPVFRRGVHRFAGDLAVRGLAGAIIPDLPVEESAPWEEAGAASGVATVLLAPPSAGDRRLEEIARRSTGFVYAMALMGVTGERGTLAGTAKRFGDRLRAVTEKPVLLGIGISNGTRAAEAAEHADGVIVGTAVVRRVLEGAGPREVGDFVHSLREGLDG